MTSKETNVSRRGLLRAAAGSATAVAAGTAATGMATAQEYGGWFTSDASGGAVDNYDGTTVDRTGQDEVTVEVGSQGNGGSFAFGPAAVEISPGTEVTFDWVSDTHNVLVESQPDDAGWEGYEAIENEGFSYSHTFETQGIYKYYCEPHLSLGMKGAIVVSDASSGGGGSGDGGGGGGEPVPVDDYGGWFTSDASGGAVDNYDGTTVDRTGQDEVTVEVGSQGNGGSFAFGPAAVRVSPGTEVTFDWVSDTHNVLVESQPDDAGWEGYEAVENEGFSYSHTFETKGIYKYYCEPHLSLGMKGAVVVGPAPGSGGGGGGGPTGRVGGGISLWEVLFSGTILLGMLAPIIASFYRGKDVGEVEYEPSTDTDEESTGTPEAPPEEPVQELDHDEYDPVGTASLIVVYFLILLGLWVFMYFVEFLGNAPTITG
ncbi:halocyanin domain-containing protein [Halobellus ordinarius]|uniref:halocyanin domain-containing protein n=1 Tax=Halobellus ordinarius TaxID=3075120 RepID=UPI0028804429|nr:halocyanin domain-containing protein [Halobellus sp. ZY16]